VLVWPQGGCLVPQSIEPSVTSPHPPPSFLVQTFPPYLLLPVLTLFRQGSADVSPCHCQLVLGPLSVEESDPTITLEARWFIDYDVTVPSSTRPWQTDELAGTFDDPTKTTRATPAFAFDADRELITTSGVHIVEVVVGEQGGFDPASATLPNRGMLTGFTPAVYRFAIDVHLEQATGQCSQIPPSQSPPSTRVCQ
jgi:hypothetical protein